MFDKRTLITLLSTLALGTAINPNNICVLVKDETKIVDEENCAGYYTCEAGKATPATCPNNYYFDKDGQNCMPKSQVSCLGQDENACEGVLGKKFVAMSGSCSGYYYCENGVATAGNCPNGLNFNPKEEKCQYDTEYGCGVAGGNPSNPTEVNENLLCGYLPNGLYFGSATNCRTWQKCTKNIVKSGTCGEFVFNVQTLECDYEDQYDCQQRGGDAGETGGSPTEPCNVEDEDKVEEDPNTCTGYMICRGEKYHPQKCSNGYFYDTASGNCTVRQHAKNSCDRCEGTTMKFVNKVDDGCVGYWICSGGKQNGAGKCTDGYFFNEIYGSCIKGEKPDFKVCQSDDDDESGETPGPAPGPGPAPPCECADDIPTNCNSLCEETDECECICEECPPLPVCDSCDDSTINSCYDDDCAENKSCECECAPDECPS